VKLDSRGFKIALVLIALVPLHLVFWPLPELETHLLPPLLCGWYELPARKIQEGFLSRHLPMILGSLILALLLCQPLMKGFCARFLPQHSWSWGRSLGLCGLFVSAAVASIGLVVIFHQGAWLLKSRATPWSLVAHPHPSLLVKNLERKFEKSGLGSDWGRIGGAAYLSMTVLLEEQRDFRWSFDCDASGRIQSLRLWLSDSPSRGELRLTPRGATPD
jgi:hypothetical protein